MKKAAGSKLRVVVANLRNLFQDLSNFEGLLEFVFVKIAWDKFWDFEINFGNFGRILGFFVGEKVKTFFQRSH